MQSRIVAEEREACQQASLAAKVDARSAAFHQRTVAIPSRGKSSTSTDKTGLQALAPHGTHASYSGCSHIIISIATFLLLQWVNCTRPPLAHGGASIITLHLNPAQAGPWDSGTVGPPLT